MKKEFFVAALVVVGMGVLVRGDGATTKAAEDDVKVALTDCPQAVQDAIKAAVGTGTIKEIEKENEDGKADYGVDATIDGKAYEIKVSPEGKLMKKELDDDEGEKKGGKEDDDKK